MELDEIFNFYTLAKALDDCSDGILITDAQRNDHPIVYSNRRFQEMTGYEHDDIVGQNCRFLQNSDTDQPEIDILRNALEEGTDCKVVLKNYKKNGELFYNHLSLSPIRNDQGEITHFLGIQNDVTKEKLLEQEMELALSKIRDLLK